MPTYQYTCTACEHGFEVVQAFTDDALTECPECQGRLRKVFGSVGVVFKGSGFYRTDSREKPKSEGAGTSDGKTDAATKTDSKPAKTETTSTSGSTGGSTSSDGSSSSTTKASSTAGTAA